MEANSEEKTLLDIEREELNILVQRGVKFSVTFRAKKPVKGFFRRLFRKTEFEEVTRTYEIQEPTLSTLDRLTEMWLEMAVDEDKLQNEDSIIAEAQSVTKEHAYRMARCIAIAVLGEDYYMTEIGKDGRIRRKPDEDGLNDLTELFFHSIKPSKLVGLSATITNISNLGDFLGSIRLTSGARTTQPRRERIE